MNNKWLNYTLKYIALFIFWLVLSGDIGARSLILGVPAVFFVLLISEMSFRRYASRHVFIQYHYHILWFFIIVLFEIFKAAYEHIERVLSGDDKSVIFDVELCVQDEFAVALIANAITLTPGTLTMQVHDQTLTILGFAQTDAQILEIESTILNKFQKPFMGGETAC